MLDITQSPEFLQTSLSWKWTYFHQKVWNSFGGLMSVQVGPIRKSVSIAVSSKNIWCLYTLWTKHIQLPKRCVWKLWRRWEMQEMRITLSLVAAFSRAVSKSYFDVAALYMEIIIHIRIWRNIEPVSNFTHSLISCNTVTLLESIEFYWHTRKG